MRLDEIHRSAEGSDVPEQYADVKSVSDLFAASDLGPDQNESLCEPGMSDEECSRYLSDWVRWLQGTCNIQSEVISDLSKEVTARQDGQTI